MERWQEFSPVLSPSLWYMWGCPACVPPGALPHSHWGGMSHSLEFSFRGLYLDPQFWKHQPLLSQMPFREKETPSSFLPHNLKTGGLVMVNRSCLQLWVIRELQFRVLILGETALIFCRKRLFPGWSNKKCLVTTPGSSLSRSQPSLPYRVGETLSISLSSIGQSPLSFLV